MLKLNVAITHDVDRIKKSYQYFSKTIKAVAKRDVNGFAYQFKEFFNNKDTYWNFDDIIKTENSFNIKSTFYFLNESIPFDFLSIKNWPLSLGRYKIDNERILNIIKFLDENGFEVGVHGSFNSFNNLDLLKKEKKQLELILNKEIIGIRQHHLNLNENTWNIQRKVGFKYDTSFGSNDFIGYLNDKINPFNPFNDSFTVFPMAIMDKTFCSDKNKWEKLKEIIDLTKKNQAILVLNWHTDTFNEYEFPGFKNDFIKIIQILKDEGATFDTLNNYYNKLQPCAV